MFKIGRKSVLILIAVFTFNTCIDPYKPDLRGYESVLVVDGLLTDQNTSSTIKLSRTMRENITPPPAVTDAEVFITDNTGGRFNLKHSGEGIYKTDSTEFQGIPGKTYILHISTSEGEKYESEPSLMLPVPDIDSIYFSKDQAYFNNRTEIREGISIYLDTKGNENNKYYRWDYVETWKFKVPNPKRCEYINENLVVLIPDVKEYCYKTNKAQEVIIHQVYTGEPNRIEKEPLLFIASNKSDRLMLQYSILVNQYSISKKDYDFWNNLKGMNETLDDIFAAQPYPVISNIHNVSNPEETILGYFQVSAVKQKRTNIPFSDIKALNIPFYFYPCNTIEDSPFILPWSKFTPPLTWDDLYYMYTTSGYTFVEPKYVGTTTELDRLIFVKPECADCELTGTMKKPDFWIDLK